MIGCDALDRLAWNLRLGSRQIDGIFDELSRTFAGLAWSGCDSENFGRIWQNRGQAGFDDIPDLHRPDVSVFAGKPEGIPFKGGDGDVVTWLPVHGEDPADEGFGATIFETSGEGHSEYFDGTSLENLALIAVGTAPSSAE